MGLQEPLGVERSSLLLGEPILIPLSPGMALGMGSPSPALSLLSWKGTALILGPAGASSKQGLFSQDNLLLGRRLSPCR